MFSPMRNMRNMLKETKNKDASVHVFYRKVESLWKSTDSNSEYPM